MIPLIIIVVLCVPILLFYSYFYLQEKGEQIILLLNILPLCGVLLIIIIIVLLPSITITLFPVTYPGMYWANLEEGHMPVTTIPNLHWVLLFFHTYCCSYCDYYVLDCGGLLLLPTVLIYY